MPPKYTPEQRVAAFWNKVDKSGGDDACWIWTAGHYVNGYGSVKWQGRQEGAHRISWIITHGDIPDSLHILHNCPNGDNPSCVNPAHLWVGTPQDNTDDMMRKGRKRPAHGERCRHKYTDVQIAEMRQRFESKELTRKHIVEEYHISLDYLYDVLNYKWRKDA